MQGDFFKEKIINIIISTFGSVGNEDSMSADQIMKNSELYRAFQEERDHILKNKWYMSQREGRDVGFERALMDWVCNHRDEYKKHLTPKDR